MGPSLRKNVLREMRSTLNRFLAIFAITALGAGFFAGLRATSPSMVKTGDTYFEEQNLMDMRLLSTMGFTGEDIEALQALEEVGAVMPTYAIDLLVEAADGVDAVRLHALPEDRKADNPAYISQVIVTEGRYPQAKNECLADSESHYKIGDTIRLSAQNDEDSLELMAVREFTVVGKAQSPYYISFTRGNTSIGNGSLSTFLYLDETAFDSEYYLEVQLTLAGAGGLSAQSAAYETLVDSAEAMLEEFGEQRAGARYDNIMAEYGEELADARRELEDGRAEADEKLADAWQEIEDAQAEIADGWREIEENRRKLRDAEKELADGQATLDSSRSQLQSGEAELNAGVAQYNEGVAQYNEGLAALEQLEAAYAGMQGYAGYLAAVTADPAAFGAVLEEALAVPQQLSAQLAAMGQAEVAAGLDQYMQGIQTAAGYGQLDAAAAAYAGMTEEVVGPVVAATQSEMNSARAELDSALATINASRAQIADGWAQLNSGQQALDEARQEIADGWAELADGEQTLREAEEELADGIAEYEEEKAKALAEIADAEVEIADAERELADLEQPDWYVFSRASNPGYDGFGSNVDRIGAIATLLPFFFFLVAALVCLTTMTRMVEEQRIQIGTFKALGYSKGAIALKYLLYAGLASLFGGVVGVAICYFMFPSVIWNAYRMMYIMPSITYAFEPLLIVESVLAMMVVTMLATLGACVNELRSVPAELMRPKPPKNGTRVLLERVTFIWKRLKFSHKVTVRNLFRYKKRFFMTVVGVSGCTALLLAGFGLYDSITGIAELQFGEVSHYDMVVQLTDPATAGEASQLNSKLSELGSYAYVMETAVDAENGKANNSSMTTYLVVMEDVESFAPLVTFRDRKTGALVDFPQGDGVIVTEKLADQLGVSAGDSFTVGRGSEEMAEVTVAGVAENYIYNYIYMTPEAYTALFEKPIEYTRVYLNLDEAAGYTEEEALRYVVDSANVAGAVGISEMRGEMDDMLDSLNSVIWVIIICAGLLAFVVLYNLTNINITERQREIATLKVLGFYDNEVSGYVYRENVVLTLIGIAVGLVLGIFLHRYIIITAEIDEVMFGRTVKALSYLMAAAFTLLCGLLVNLAMLKKLKNIDMVESLKSAE